MDRLAAVCEEIQSHASRLKKVAILAAYLKSLDDRELAIAVQFLSVGPVARASTNHTLFEVEDKAELKIGGSVLHDALRVASGWDKQTLSVCYAQVGDIGETISLLMRGLSTETSLTLQAADDIYQELFQARTTARRVAILVAAFRACQPLTLKYFVKVITRGLRIGLMSRQVEEAVAAACEEPSEAVRAANNRLGDLARVAVAARHGQLSSIEARLFHPMDFMLAKPLDHIEDLADPAEWLIEDKYDGIRAQVHFDRGAVRIFSRGMEDISHVFPEIVASCTILPGDGVIDGEILAFREGRALNFNILQRRLAKKQVRATLLQEIPTIFIAYDLLLRNGQLLLNEPFSHRREELEALRPLTTSQQYRATSYTDVDRLFAEARARGNEGLLLKRPDGLYEPGKRTGAWQKLKRPYGTLDVVITAAEQGSGRRATVFSDYTFGVRADSGFVNVGKAYSGLTDIEVKELTRQLRTASIEKFGRMMLVKPEIVLEVAFDGVQRSTRHKGGYSLRFPRILRWRKDKRPEDCDGLERVEALYRASVE
jgi:DNA ligase 1